MQSERFAVGLTPMPTAARVARQRSVLRWRIGSMILSAILLTISFWWFRPAWEPWVYVLVGVLWGFSTVFWVIVSAVGLSRAKRDLARIPDGPVFFVDPHGLEFVWPRPVAVMWGDVDALRVQGHHLGAGPNLVLHAHGAETVSVPLSFLDASASVIDLAVQANSMGRIRLDAAALDALV
ncbi:hypothetical protein [Tessaracoccus caeni]|uniref:hypothetical protein n=1 Tax=Tessaracoccus caeni TaxID=3031239 RepID=UPI0023DB7CC1|nr:hypothetical protein [Tessaracoccus caeni]MDF1489239.1 hypothetical protein [Tessaracoccus caeni]